MKTLLNAEDVAFVNNNASSLYLTLLCLSKKYSKDSVIVSRGEIIEIGGSYRLPDIIFETCLLYTSPSPRDATLSRMPSSA